MGEIKKHRPLATFPVKALIQQLKRLPGIGPESAERLAHGLPVGGGLENADELTLYRALEGRVGLR